MDISEELLRDRLRGLARPVALRYYTPDVPSAATRADHALLAGIARASDQVELHVLADRWDAAREDEVGIARTPAIVVTGAEDYGIRYYGTPDGYEFETFLDVIRAVSEGRSGLTNASRALVGALADRRHLEVLVAPT